MAGQVELIPGTALPIHSPASARQPEGRGDVIITRDREPPARVDGQPVDNIDVSREHLIDAAIRAYDRRNQRQGRTFEATAAGQTNATTGNLVLPLFECPQGMEGHVTNVTVDVPGSATITPAAPYANAASWCFLAVSTASSGQTGTVPTNLRQAMVAFAPTSSAGPILPGQWTFNEDESPVAQTGEMLYFCLVGGSIAAILNLQLQASYRVQLYQHS